VHFLWLLLSGGIVRLCKNVDNNVSFASWISPTKWALDGLIYDTMERNKYVYKPDLNPEVTITGTSILNDEYCFNTWRHASDATVSFIALGIMLGILLCVFFLSARLVQKGHRE
jgi:uncharacterized membrane protein YwzB